MGSDVQKRLADIERGARGFQVLAIVLMVIGGVAVGGGALQLLRLLRDDAGWSGVLADVGGAALGALHYFLLAWLARRAAEAFATIAGLIREVGEIV